MWNERFSEPGFVYGTEPNDFLASVVDQLPRGRALSLAEGEGRNGVFLAERGLDVWAVDGSSVGLEKAQALAASRGVHLHTEVADLADFHIAPGSWDVIVSIWCHLPTALRRRIHAEAAAGLKPGGALVLEAYTPDQLTYKTGGPQNVDMLMTLAALKEELPGLRFEVGRETVREIHEGRLHNGPSAVVQVLAFAP